MLKSETTSIGEFESNAANQHGNMCTSKCKVTQYSSSQKLAVVVLTVTIWLVVRAVFWIGFAGADDMFYVNYAHIFDRPPSNHWEFRVPAVLAIRASLRLFGPTEFAAALPTLLASGAILLSVAWFVDWPRQLNWRTQTSVLLACVIPIDVTMASYPGANLISAGLLAVGSLCFLKGRSGVPFVGALLLALGFWTHEVSFFYVAIFCLTTLAFDWRRFWKPVAACVVLSGVCVAAEGVVYQSLLGDPLARFHNAANMTSGPINYHYRFGGSAVAFFLWPVQILAFCKQFGFDLILLLVVGLSVWRRLDNSQKILFATMFLYWFWLGYGTQVPWAYKPRSRAFHYYFPLTLGIAALLPSVLHEAFHRRKLIAPLILTSAMSLHLLCLAGGGRWGQRVDVSRDLMEYAASHSDTQFLTDVHTLNEMYLVNGFELPLNVRCVNQQDVVVRLLINKGKSNSRKHQVSDSKVSAILVNRERTEKLPGKAFQEFVKQRAGDRIHQFPIGYKPLFSPFISFIGHRDFAVKNLGGEVLEVESD